MRNITQVIQERRGRVEREQSMEGRTQIVTGRILASGQGEGVVDIRFPVRFIHVPTISFGYELVENSDVTLGSYPAGSAFVSDWDFDERMGGMSRLYKGARLLLVISGIDNQATWIHWTAIGVALRGPTSGQYVAESSI